MSNPVPAPRHTPRSRRHLKTLLFSAVAFLSAVGGCILLRPADPLIGQLSGTWNLINPSIGVSMQIEFFTDGRCLETMTGLAPSGNRWQVNNGNLVIRPETSMGFADGFLKLVRGMSNDDDAPQVFHVIPHDDGFNLVNVPSDTFPNEYTLELRRP